MKRLILLVLLITLTGCQGFILESEKDQIKSFSERTNKKVIMIIVDTMIGSLVESGIDSGNMPALQFLVEHGTLYHDLVSPFPTMSVTIESSLLTGELPNKHRVPGLSWYNPREDRIINYGTSFEFLYKSGLSDGIYDALYHLNNTHLNSQVRTVFEVLKDYQLSSGAVNTLVYRGKSKHDLQFPALTDELLDIPPYFETLGPDVLIFGGLTRNDDIQSLEMPDGIFNHMGLNDAYTAKAIIEIIREGKQPDFLLAFFPDFDHEAHEHGPHYRRGFEKVDEYLQDILNEYGSWEEAIEQNIFILVGDHGSDKLLEDKEQMSINLHHLFQEFHIPALTERPSTGDLIFAVNGRMSYIYDVRNAYSRAQLAQLALADERVEFVAWLEDGWAHVRRPESDKLIRFKPGGQWKDRYDQSWSIEGETSILTLQVHPDKHFVSYMDYPDVFNQLYSALTAQESSTVILTAKSGYSFVAEGIPSYPDGGEHGGLHKNDALAAMVVTGTNKKPKHLRIIDLKQFVLELLLEEKEQVKDINGTNRSTK